MEKDHPIHLESWFELNQTVLKNSALQENVRKILQNNNDLKQQREFISCDDEFFRLLIENMKSLGPVEFDNSRQFSSVLRIAIEISKLAQSIASNYVNSLKVFMLMLKTNQELVIKHNSILKLPVSSVCKSFSTTFRSLHEKFDSQQLRFAQMHQKIITEIQKLFGDKFLGSSYIVEVTVDLQCFASENVLRDELQELLSKLKSVLWVDLISSQFYTSFFELLYDSSDARLRFVLNLCLEIIEKMMESEIFLKAALPSDPNSNFCLLITKFMAKLPHIIQSHPTIYHLIAHKISQLLCHENLSDVGFNFLECELFKAMITSDDYWTGQLSFYIFQNFLGEIEADDAIAFYLVQFQKLLRKIWNPSANISTRSQLYVISLIQFIARRHPMVVEKNIVDAELIELIMETSNSHSQRRFVESFDCLIADSTVSNYYNLMMSLKMLSFADMKLENETIGKFCELVKLIEDCDWSVNCNLVVNLMQVIIATDNNQHKLLFLLKLNPALSIEKTKTLELKLKLLELLLSFIELAELKQGLPALLSRELNRLCEGPESDVIVTRNIRRYFASGKLIPWDIQSSLNFDTNDDEYFNEEEEFLDILQSSSGLQLVHKCAATTHSKVPIISQLSQKLRTICEFSQNIDGHQLSEDDLQLSLQIRTNFERITAKSCNGNVH